VIRNGGFVRVRVSRAHRVMLMTSNAMAVSEPKLSETTRLLRDWAKGDQAALDRLTPRVYRELRRLAGSLMKHESPGHTIQATGLVHEAYLKLIDVHNVDWQHRAHFFAVAAQVMRRILLEAARKRGAAKRGGHSPRVNLEEIPDIGFRRGSELIALDDALKALAKIDPRKARVIELRFFGGLSVEETAEVLRLSADTVLRDWRLARAWLLSELGSDSPGENK
jgi:RNA polymerase sigma-70 factor, ECF subfamily